MNSQSQPVATTDRNDASRFVQRGREQRSRWRVIQELTPLVGGAQTYPAMLKAIVCAKHSICLETYIFAGDKTGAEFTAALVERAKAGVIVRVIYDGVGSSAFRGTFERAVQAAGGQTVEFHPIAPWRKRWNLSHRDHRKILVVDDEIAFVGGLNIGDDYQSAANGGGDWYDMHCQLRGPVVIDLARLFRRTWLANGGESYLAPGPVTTGAAQPPAIRMLENGPRRFRKVVLAAYLRAIAMAHHSIRIKNAYFLPEPSVRKALARAAKRGLEVSILVPGRSDVRIVEWASYWAFRALVRDGARIYRWRGPMMHAKSAVIDATWLTIGSYNFDSRSLRYNLEVAIEAAEPLVGEQLATMFAANVANCDEFTAESWKKLPRTTKCLAWFAYLFRHWL